MLAPPAAYQTAFASGHWREVTFIEINYAGGPVRVCSLPWDYTGFLGETWLLGAGHVAVSRVEERSDLGASEFDLILAGVKAAVIVAARVERVIGRRVRIWKGILGDDGALIDDPGAPKSLWVRDVVIDVRGATITYKISDRSERADTIRPAYRSRQRVRSLGNLPSSNPSKFGDLIAALPQKKVVWPGKGYAPEKHN